MDENTNIQKVKWFVLDRIVNKLQKKDLSLGLHILSSMPLCFKFSTPLSYITVASNSLVISWLESH